MPGGGRAFVTLSQTDEVHTMSKQATNETIKTTRAAELAIAIGDVIENRQKRMARDIAKMIADSGVTRFTVADATDAQNARQNKGETKATARQQIKRARGYMLDAGVTVEYDPRGFNPSTYLRKGMTVENMGGKYAVTLPADEETREANKAKATPTHKGPDKRKEEAGNDGDEGTKDAPLDSPAQAKARGQLGAIAQIRDMAALHPVSAKDDRVLQACLDYFEAIAKDAMASGADDEE